MGAPLIRVFGATSLGLALTAGFGLGQVLLFSASLGLDLAGARWATLVALHGHVPRRGIPLRFAQSAPTTTM